jgi:hypothetical protein
MSLTPDGRMVHTYAMQGDTGMGKKLVVPAVPRTNLIPSTG